MSERRREEKRRSEKTEDPMICSSSGGSKSRLAKAAGAKPPGQIWKSKCTKDFMFGPLLKVEMLN